MYEPDGHVWLRQFQRSVRLLPDVREALLHFEGLFEMAPSALLVTDVDLRITDANTAAMVLFNKQFSRLRGLPLVMFVVKAERAAFHAIVAELLETGLRVVRPLCIRRSDTVEVDMVITASAFPAESGRPGSVYWVISDSLTERQVDLL